MKRITIVILIVLFSTSCADKTKKDTEEALSENISNTDIKRSLVSVFEAEEAPFKHYIELQGNVDTKENIIINAEFSGALMRVLVNEGDKVTKGDLLAEIADGGLAQQLSQTRTQQQLARETYNRQKKLWDQKIGSEMEFLQAKTNYNTYSDGVRQLQKQLSKTRIRAPFTGTIDEIFSEQGSVVSPGVQIMRIVNLDHMFIEAEVPEKYIKGIHDSVDVNVNFPVLNEQFDTKISQVSDYINPNNRSFKITIDVPNKNGNIKPNLTSRLKINDYTNPNAILIPQDIVSEDSQGNQYVYIINTMEDGDNISKRAYITVGETQENLAEILEGINQGDLIIKEGARSVKEGQKVKILNVDE